MRHLPLIMLLLAMACEPARQTESTTETAGPEPVAYSLAGEPLYAPEPSDALWQQLGEKVAAYAQAPTLDNLIWVGRFLAYAGKYAEADSVYTAGLQQWPDESRLYRHRGHRYISVRRFQDAIADLEKAAELIADEENSVEPDGMPNAQGIPVSTRHGNIWYHLGLAYYLTGQYEKALQAYQNCLNIALSNDDNLVSATHWITLILARLGRAEEASDYLARVTDELNVIENHSYWSTCQYYKGEVPADSLVNWAEVSPATMAQAYGVAAYTASKQDFGTAQPLYQAILATDSWASFGYIAAEADWQQFSE